MKRIQALCALTALLIAGCEDTIDNGGGTNNGGGDNGGGNGSIVTPTVEVTLPELADTDDDISNTTFARTVTVTFSTAADATVNGTSDNFAVTVDGNRVTIVNNGSEAVKYILTGTSTNGKFKLHSAKKQALVLSNLTLTNPTGAAINVQGPTATPNKGKRTFVVVDGTNSLADGPNYTETPSTEDEKGVIFSEGQLIFSGEGSLTVTATGKAGISSDDYVRVMAAPTLRVNSSAGHGIRGKDWILISDGTLEVGVTADMKKGFSSDSVIRIDGGISRINISGGVAYDSEDQEYTGTAGIKADKQFVMTGGAVQITNTGTGGKGVRAGCYDATNPTLPDSYITGGTLTVTTKGQTSSASLGDVSAKGIRIGYKETTGSGKTATSVCAGNLVITGGVISVNSTYCEAIEVKGNLTFAGGETYATSTKEDAINSQSDFVVDGGMIYAYSSGNDAMDANGDMKINGGYVFAICTKGSPEVALDANTEEGHKLYINEGATVVAYGGLERGAQLSQTCYTMSCTAGKWNSLTGSDGELCAFKAPSGVTSVVVSAPGLKSGKKDVTVSGGTYYCQGTWTLAGISTISGGSSVNLSTYTSSGGNTPGPGGPGWH